MAAGWTVATLTKQLGLYQRRFNLRLSLCCSTPAQPSIPAAATCTCTLEPSLAWRREVCGLWLDHDKSMLVPELALLQLRAVDPCPGAADVMGHEGMGIVKEVRSCCT